MRPSSPPEQQQQRGTSIDMQFDPIPLFPDIVVHDESSSTLQSDGTCPQHNHPLLLTSTNSRRMEKDDRVDGDDGRAAFSAAATDVGGTIHRGHKRGDTFEPLPFRTGAGIIGGVKEAPAAAYSHLAAGEAYLPSEHRQYDHPSHSGEEHQHQQPYQGQQIKMQLYPTYDQERQTHIDPSSPTRLQPPIDKGHRKVPSFVTPMHGYDDAMIDDKSAMTTQHQYGGYSHHHGQHGYYPPHRLWQHQYGGGQQYQHHQHVNVRPQLHRQGDIPKPPPPGPPIFHPLADEKVAPKHTIKRRYFQDVVAAYSTPVRAPLPAYHAPLPAYGPIHHYNEEEDQQGHRIHRRGPSIVFDNDEDWHQQSPTVLYTSWSAGSSTNARDDADARLMAPKKKPNKKKTKAAKKKRKSKPTVSSFTSDGALYPLAMDLDNDDNIENKTAAAGDDEDMTVSSLDIGLPLEPLVNFQKMLKSSEETQKALEQWDKKMGLKRSHSKTMWDSDRSRQNLKKVILGIQRAKLRQIITKPSKTMDGESSVVHEVGASDAPELSAKTAMGTFTSSPLGIRMPTVASDLATAPLSSLLDGVVSKDAEPSSSDFSILSESRDVSNQLLAVSSPRKSIGDEVEPAGTFILGSPTTSGGGTHIKTSSASDIQPLSPAEPSPVRIVFSSKCA